MDVHLFFFNLVSAFSLTRARAVANARAVATKAYATMSRAPLIGCIDEGGTRISLVFKKRKGRDPDSFDENPSMAE